MADLSKMTRKVTFILSLKGYEDYELINLKLELIKYFNSCCDFYAFIFHDKDINDNGELKTLHLHAVCQYTVDYGKTRLKTHLNNLSEALQFNPFAITVNYAKDFIGNIRYLIHLDSPYKYQYNRDSIITNDTSLLNDYLDSSSEFLTGDKLYEICSNCKFNHFKIMCYLGPQKYTYYRRAIEACYEEYKNRL